jgi:hypothetical protein
MKAIEERQTNVFLGFNHANKELVVYTEGFLEEQKLDEPFIMAKTRRNQE